jgi:Protein of unknown function (DUF5818)
MQRTFLSLTGFVILLALTAAPVQLAGDSIPRLQSQPQRETETFFGTILKNGENFVLSDSATKSKYVLDSPQKVSRYEGLTVKVIGTLDVAKGLIHVETIQSVT